MKIDLFPANPAKENILKLAEEILSRPDVKLLFTSNPYVLERFAGHKKLKDANDYDNSPEAKKAGIQHNTHFDITLSDQFGGTEQIKQAYISASKPKQTYISSPR